MRLDEFLGRPVIAPNGTRVGRLEEFRAYKEGNGWAVAEFLIGAAGLWERLDLGARLLLARDVRGYVARWDQLQFDDDGRVRLTCPVEELNRL